MSHHFSGRFRTFAEAECKNSSPLYHALSLAIAEDDAILDIAAHSSPNQPVPNLFFAAVQYLLSSDSDHPLAAFYATYRNPPENPSKAYPAFRDFVLNHRQDILTLLATRLVQTNEVRRCAYLLPAFLFATSHFEVKPLALVEIGTSAGLNLLWDQYRYSYGDSNVYGDLSSPVHVTSSFRGDIPTVLSAPLPTISHRIGLDLNIVDTSIPDQADWLRALVWPEHHERRSLMNAALDRRKAIRLDLRAGNGFSMFKNIADEISDESLLCVYHTHVANQISEQARESFLKTIAELGARRDLVHVFNNIKPNLHLTAYRQGQSIDLPLANTDGHARWVEWLPK
jgi:hypothetical protein